MGILGQCTVLVGNEGGAGNMAKALGVPSFSIFSPFINKGAWHGMAYENHDAVHLNDYYPELVQDKERKVLRAQSLELYKALIPELIEQPLLKFMKKHLH
jgi:heptosyltransferase-2